MELPTGNCPALAAIAGIREEPQKKQVVARGRGNPDERKDSNCDSTMSTVAL